MKHMHKLRTHADERRLGTKRHLGVVSGDIRRKPLKSAVTSFGEKDVQFCAAAAWGVASARAVAVLAARTFWDFRGGNSSSRSPTSPIEPPNSKNKLSLLRESALRMFCAGAGSLSSSSSSSPSELRHGIFSSAGNSRIVRGERVAGSVVVMLVVGLRPLLMRCRCFKSGADGQTKGAHCRLFAGRSGVRLRAFHMRCQNCGDGGGGGFGSKRSCTYGSDMSTGSGEDASRASTHAHIFASP